MVNSKHAMVFFATYSEMAFLAPRFPVSSQGYRVSFLDEETNHMDLRKNKSRYISTRKVVIPHTGLAESR
jgi:hypothetical protein